ncbi:MAG TPA: DUF1294 domain-containing protein [Caulobacteraceae bacterium]
MFILYLVAVNALTFIAFAQDKRAAVEGEWRVRESTLLGLAAIGGGLGAVVAQITLRHKTRKEPFRTMLYVVIALNLLLVVLIR